MCREVPSEVDKILRTPIENYYQVLSTFVHLSELRRAPAKDEDDDG